MKLGVEQPRKAILDRGRRTGVIVHQMGVRDALRFLARTKCRGLGVLEQGVIVAVNPPFAPRTLIHTEGRVRGVFHVPGSNRFQGLFVVWNLTGGMFRGSGRRKVAA